MNFNRNFRIAAAALFTISLLMAGSAAAQQTYNFSSQTYGDVSGTYPAGGNIDLSFTVPQPLAPNLDNVDVGAMITDYQCDDSVRTYGPNDTEIMRFRVTTDGLGNITTYSISLYEEPRTATPGELFQLCEVAKVRNETQSFCQENAGDIECGGQGCDSGVPEPQGANWGSSFDFADGVDQDVCPASGFQPNEIVVETTPIPAGSAIGNALLIVLLGLAGMLALGFNRMRHRRFDR